MVLCRVMRCEIILVRSMTVLFRVELDTLRRKYRLFSKQSTFLKRDALLRNFWIDLMGTYCSIFVVTGNIHLAQRTGKTSSM